MTPALTFTLLVAPAIPVVEIPPTWAINDLADAPHAGDRFRFPPSAVAEAMLGFNTRFRDKLAEERRIWPESMQHHFDAATDEARELREPWFYLSWAQWSVRREWERRLDLKRLRECLGEEAYRAGEIGPVVPTWRYREMK